MKIVLGEKLAELFKKNMPDAFVFALTLTLITTIGAITWADASILETIQAWYKGFWLLLEFGMQMILILVTGYSIALSPLANKYIFKVTQFIHSPKQVYLFVISVGMLLSLISWGWMVITAVMARGLAQRIKGIYYPYLIACVYFSGGLWVNGLSSTIPLLLNTENNYLIETGILSSTISTSYTLGSILNITIILLTLLLGAVLFSLFIPKNSLDLHEMLSSDYLEDLTSIEQEANELMLPYPAISDRLNNSRILQYLIGIMGLTYIAFHFSTKGFDLNLNIMIFIFMIFGMILHRTPIRYGIAMKRASSNISGIIFQYPFYAGIMGIMIYSGLGSKMATWMASVATIHTYPLYSYLTGGIINFAIPSAGGEFAVIGPSILDAVKEIGAGMSENEMRGLISRAALSVAYGESLTNLLQPFYLLIILPIMGVGIKIQARDVMGFLILPFLIFFILFAVMVVFMPL